eukprot:6212889-Pleurochrysis_carterae.AAC.4
MRSSTLGHPNPTSHSERQLHRYHLTLICTSKSPSARTPRHNKDNVGILSSQALASQRYRQLRTVKQEFG